MLPYTLAPIYESAIMPERKPISLPIFAAALLGACTQTPGEITRDTKPFDGIDEQASITLLGTEPFWNLDIAPEEGGYNATFQTPDNLDGATFAVARFAGNNGVGFNGDLDGKQVQAAITPGACSDGMSDRSFPYTATLAMGEDTFYGCAYTSDEPFTGSEAP